MKDRGDKRRMSEDEAASNDQYKDEPVTRIETQKPIK